MTDPKNDELTWKCSNCGFTAVQAVPPEKCPSCGEECEFLNATCYTPDCGGPGGGMDPRIK